MIICIADRDEAPHIVDYYYSRYKFYYTFCEKSIIALGASTYTTDSIFPGICKKCESLYRELYMSDSNFSGASLNSEIMKQCLLSESQIETPQQKYAYSFSRGWRKLAIIKRTINGNRK